MRPTVEEQLQGTCRILETVVAPAVAEPYARMILDALVGNLRMLSAALPAVPGFLREDNQASGRLLDALRASVPSGLAVRIAAALDLAEPDAADSAALDARNRQLRELLGEAVCAEGLTPELRAAALKYMTGRASRVPMRFVLPTPNTPAPRHADTTR